MRKLNPKTKRIDSVEVISVYRGKRKVLIIKQHNGVLEAEWKDEK